MFTLTMRRCKWAATLVWLSKIMFIPFVPAPRWREAKNQAGVVAAINSKRKTGILLTSLLLMTFAAIAQQPDTTYHKREIPATEIEILYNMYHQDGDHSAVTGGIGTEKLTIYAPGVDVTFNGEKSSFNLNMGADVITSASTDNIDFAISSASYIDMRSHTDIHYSRQVSKTTQVGIGTGFSLESDYLSFPFRADLYWLAPDKLREIQASFAYIHDDLRWGRLNPDYKRPVTLVYPYELRYKQWFDIYNRYSYNFKTGYSQVINRRLRVGIFPELIIQTGLLSTPFHRVYFANDSLKVENLPQSRTRIPIGIKANYFAGGSTVLKGSYQFYSDNFGISAHTLQLESVFKVKHTLGFSPFVKVYTQTGSKYFKPYAQHDPAEVYYSSDYDLSEIKTIQLGLGFRWAPFANLARNFLFDEINLRYSYLKRSDGLYAHLMSAAFRFSRNKVIN